MEEFRYNQIDLEQHVFRLLRLCKGSEAEIKCELIQGWLDSDEATFYEALSYAWGSSEKDKRIKLNGKQFAITENLFCALQHLRSCDVDRILWVDAICINQAHKEEQGHQVRQMGKIYSQASQVIFWLGPQTFATDIVMGSLQKLQQECVKYPYRSWGTADKHWLDLWSYIKDSQRLEHQLYLESYLHSGMKSLLERSWFRRIWIIQEVANAKTALVCVGTKSVSSRIFALAPWLIGIQPESHCQAVLDIMPGQSRETSWWSQKRDLYTLLQKFKRSEASDSRDMIYALLGISSDGYDADTLRPDYEKTDLQVVHAAASFLFGLTECYYHTISISCTILYH